LEAREIVSIDADGQRTHLLELMNGLDVRRLRYGEVGEEPVGLDAVLAFEKSELVEQVTVHEHVARAGGQVEVVVAQVQRLRDAVAEEIVVHDDARALLLRIGAEAAIEIAEARGFDAQRRARAGNELAPRPAIETHQEGIAPVPYRFHEQAPIEPIHRGPPANCMKTLASRLRASPLGKWKNDAPQ